ncbi:peptidyl-prolyl cis-trans isomerase [Tilletiaria anomala UBC 951]|uniref:peptidylprolyl isomerase n=1 Tax=Tilletiaria anomala (strain ATCC 24038 / CBS 436.72 / UBC 951) TaxID=1037660 RepID=A0A066VQR4_TILAU|nr:peptidyl-prolyl cis-trans isomerase [Tilletiaria anomala UBC 951]KDN44087.1 peptidyl-prolyl cis-trans isomerase [Tilletiaria anomala UBC 951]
MLPPPLAPGAADEDESSDDDVGPAPPTAAEAAAADATSDQRQKKKRRRVLSHEGLYMSHLPCATRYYKSFMHRDTLCRVDVTPHPTDFLITASVDGHVKFWKKQEEGIEFVKHYRAHLGVIVDTSVSADGVLYASISSDGTAKVFDVANFDMINMLTLGYTPRACCWMHRKGKAASILAIAEEGSHRIRLYDGRGDGEPFAVVENVHKKPCHLLAYNEAYDCAVSADVVGMIEYWRPDEPYDLPSNQGLWSFKSETDLFDFKKAKSVPCTITFAPDGSKFSTTSLPDRQVRLFSFKTGKLLRKYDESLRAVQEMQQQQQQQQRGEGQQHMDEMDFGRRLAVERDLYTGAGMSAAGGQDAGSGSVALLVSGAQNAAGLASANALFDESGNFLIYASMLGIKVINIVTNKASILLGRDEATRFLRLALFQGAAAKKAMTSLALAASDNPLAQVKRLLDPTLFSTAHKRARFYLFTRNEPESDPKSKAGGERDVFNEKPTHEEMAVATGGGGGSSSSRQLARGAVLHTSVGDIHLRLYPEHAPKAVENFAGLARRGYYDGVLFHRVIAKFMLQTGDPLGDGTGGQSIWGAEFADEFTRALRHDRPYTLSMANAGPNTNGSQFFLTTVPTPWLDDKHTIFGRATAGLDVVHRIENTRVDKNDRPRQDIKIVNVSLQD